MRIVHVIARLNVGGAALHVLHIAHAQQLRGHDVTVVAGTLALGEESMEYVADELGTHVLELPALQRPLSLRADAAAILGLRSIIRRERPDILHTHTAKAGATGRLAALLSGRARPRVIVHTYHGHVLSGYFDQRWERFFRASSGVSHISPACSSPSARRCATISCGCASPPRIGSRWCTTASTSLSGARPTTAHGSADGPSSASATDTFAIGWAGRLTAIKRPLDLVRTLRAVLDQGVDAVLVLVGDGELRGATKRSRATSASPSASASRLSRDVREWYAAVDVSLLTSRTKAPGRGDRVAGRRRAGRRDATQAARATVVDDGETGYLRPDRRSRRPCTAA